MKLSDGKIPPSLFEEVVFKNLGIERREVVVGPSMGIDGAVVEVDNHSIIVSMDPITGALKQIGWLAVNVNANDIATFGVEPAFLFSCILLPESADRRCVETICAQMNQAAKELGIAIVGGHCEVTPGLNNPIVVGCMVGMAQKGDYVTAGNARPRDKLIMTKSAGIEGTAILASDREKQLKEVVDATTLSSAKRFYRRISIVKDALTAFRTGGVHAMHDATEGGIVGAVHEMADATNLGVKIFPEKMSVEPETQKICEFYRIDPLQLIASGSLLIAAKQEFAENIVKALKKNRIHAEIIGEFLSSTEKRLIAHQNGKTSVLARSQTDHLWQALQHS
jgi:hydrogenase maturation factor